MYCAFDDTAILLADEFFQEAERLWDLEKGNDTYLNMAGAALLSLSLVGRDRDLSVLLYTQEVKRMGIALRLFGSDPIAGITVGDDYTASCYAAWGGFNWNM